MDDSSRQTDRSGGRFFGVALMVLVFRILLPFIYSSIMVSWPPAWVERRTQRQLVLKRVQAAGGWSALKRDCDALADKYKDSETDFHWHGPNTNGLPPAIAALQPRSVDFFSRKRLPRFGLQGLAYFGSNTVVRIEIFGLHATGGRDQSWLGLDVVCEPGLLNYNPHLLWSKTPLSYWSYRKITNDIYEYY